MAGWDPSRRAGCRSAAWRGRRVVRLRGGDPVNDEEIAACRNAGIAVEKVPGIAAARGAAVPALRDGRVAARSA